MRNGDFVRQLVGWEFHGHPVATHQDLVVLAEGPVRGFRGEQSQRRVATTLYSAPKGNPRVQRRDLLVEHGALGAARLRDAALLSGS